MSTPELFGDSMLNKATSQPSPLSSRRLFLTGAIGLTLGNLLSGCARQNGQTLSIQVLNGSIPLQVIAEFRKHLKQTSTAGTLEIGLETQLQKLFEALQSWKRSAQTKTPTANPFGWVPLINKPTVVPDLVTLGDYWLDKAIQQGLIQPFNPQHLPGWEQLPQPWQDLVTRTSPTGAGDRVWGMPYRWGSTVIAYRQDIFKEKGLPLPTDWSDLWRSDLRGHISLLDQPREVIGLTLKKLGQSYNTANLNAVPNLKAELAALNRQVKFYSSDAYLQPLLLGDTWLAVGWSTDILPLMQRVQTIAAVVPQSGTALWSDLWVRPATAPSEIFALAADWVRFCWQPDIASQLSLLSHAASPMVVTTDPSKLPAALRQNSVLLPAASVQKASEFLKPLDPAAIKQYQATWKSLRQVVAG